MLPAVTGVQQSLQPVYQLNGSNEVLPLPVNVAASNTEIYLEMYGTGIRNANNVAVTVGGKSVPVLYFGQQKEYAGEDQVNVGPDCRPRGGGWVM